MSDTRTAPSFTAEYTPGVETRFYRDERTAQREADFLARTGLSVSLVAGHSSGFYGFSIYA